DTRIAVDDILAHGAVLDLAEGVLHFAGGRLAFLITGQGGDGFVTQLTQTVVARLFVGNGVRLADTGTEPGLDGVQQGGVFRRRLPVPGGLARFSGQLLDRLDG